MTDGRTRRGPKAGSRLPRRVAAQATCGLIAWVGAASLAAAQERSIVSTTRGEPVAEERFVRVADTISGTVSIRSGESTMRVRLELAKGVPARYETEFTKGTVTQRMTVRLEPDTVRVTFSTPNTTTTKVIPVPDRLPLIVFQNPVMSILEPLQYVAVPEPRSHPVKVAVFLVDIGDIQIWTLASPSAGTYRLTTPAGLEIDVSIVNGRVGGAAVQVQQFEAKASPPVESAH